MTIQDGENHLHNSPMRFSQSIAPPGQEGGCAIKEKSRSHNSGADGVVGQVHVLEDRAKTIPIATLEDKFLFCVSLQTDLL